MSLTIDASVFVAASREEEVHYPASREFLQHVRAQAQPLIVFCPALVLPECSAAIARPTDDPALAAELVSLVEAFPGLQFVPLDQPLARRAAQVARDYRLRGADSVYAAVAEALGTTLVTWDVEMLERGAAVVSTMTPAEWVEARAAVQEAVEE
jgi:predicted nucleic acid-binding protein